jgi:hypothetical protein
MSKIAVECPHCHNNYVELETNFFARVKEKFTEGKEISGPVCPSCGERVKVKRSMLTTTECSHCGNTVVYDQGKGDKALCPVCGKLVNTLEDKEKRTAVTCPQCRCTVNVPKSMDQYSCPICGAGIDVQKEIELEKISKEGLASVVKYEGDNNTFVWKHPVEDFNIGSQLIVHESQEAIFFRDGQTLDLFPSGRYTLETQNIPLISEVYNTQLEPKGMFHSEVYFINMTTQMGIKWGTDSKVRLFDPATKIPIEIGARGEFNIRVLDSRRLLLRLVGTAGGLDRSALLVSGYNMDADGSGASDVSPYTAEPSSSQTKGYFRSFIMTRVKSYLARTIKESGINILEIDEHLDELSDALKIRVNEGLEGYGLIIPEFFVEQSKRQIIEHLLK